jgi:3-oxoacyl-[acyl-carrier protein] reductase
MDLQLSGRTALVTGASAGIGAGVVEVLSREGVVVVATARRADLLNSLADRVEASGGRRPVLIAADITDKADVARIAREAVEAVGPIQILVNCAGGSRPLPIEAGDDAWDEAMALNFTAVRRMTHALLPSMRAARWGRIINISGSMEPRSINAASAAKAALHLWAKGLACDVAREGITINTIPPGRIESEQIMQKLHPTEEARRDFIEKNIPIGYFGKPEDIGHLVAFLASPLAGYMTGNVIPVDGGMHHFAH